MTILELNCPHCKQNILSLNTGLSYKLGKPLRNCPHCGGEYLYPNVYEWSIAGPLIRIFYCFFANARCVLALMTAVDLINQSWRSALIWGVIWITFCLLRLKIFDSKEIRESYQRTKDNPEYIQKLSDLGYMAIDIRIDPYYK